MNNIKILYLKLMILNSATRTITLIITLTLSIFYDFYLNLRHWHILVIAPIAIPVSNFNYLFVILRLLQYIGSKQYVYKMLNYLKLPSNTTVHNFT